MILIQLKNGLMKIKVGRYHSQWGIGINYVYFNDMYRSISIELIFFYIELIIKDYPEEWEPDGRI